MAKLKCQTNVTFPDKIYVLLTSLQAVLQSVFEAANDVKRNKGKQVTTYSHCIYQSDGKNTIGSIQTTNNCYFSKTIRLFFLPQVFFHFYGQHLYLLSCLILILQMLVIDQYLIFWGGSLFCIFSEQHLSVPLLSHHIFITIS